MNNEIWILGATGRSGRAIAARLAAQHALVLVGRDPARLREVAAKVGGESRTLVAGSADAVVTELAHSTPAVVVNLIGPFTETGLRPAFTHLLPLGLLSLGNRSLW